MHRAFVPELTELVREVDVDGAEGRHLVAACRIRVGERVELFNGAGLVADAVVVETHKSNCRVIVDSFSQLPNADAAALALASALPKGDRSQWLIEKASELGVGRFIPLESDRSVVAPGDRKLDKLRRTVVESCKQCGRAWLMPIEAVTPFRQLIETCPAGIMLHPSGMPMAKLHRPLGRTTVAVGPEGGWTDDELQLAADRQWSIVRLPGHILRIETAGLAVAAAWRLEPAPESAA